MTSSSGSHSKFDFREGMKELEAITKWFESSDIDLNEALVKFERGMELATKLKEHLASVENRIEKIKKQFDAPSVTEEAEVEIPVSPPETEEPGLF